MGYLAGTVFILTGIYVIYWGFNRLQLQKSTADLKLSYVRMLAPGLVQVKGKVVAEETLSSPYSKTNCVYYKYSIAKPVSRSNDDNRLMWQHLGGGEQMVPFILDDNTGQVRIDPEGAEIHLPEGRAFRSASGKSTSMKERMEKLREADRQTQEETGKKGFIRKIDSAGPLDVPDDLVEFEKGSLSLRTGIGTVYTDVSIEPGADIIVIGVAIPTGPGSFEIQKDSKTPVFIISRDTPVNIQAGIQKSMRNAFLIGPVMIILGVIVFALV